MGSVGVVRVASVDVGADWLERATGGASPSVPYGVRSGRVTKRGVYRS